MAKRSPKADDRTAPLALCLIDLRAHFEAQLRILARVEHALQKCRIAPDEATFAATAGILRSDIHAIADNRRNVGDLVEQISDAARALTFLS
jgi:hypothetical protein